MDKNGSKKNQVKDAQKAINSRINYKGLLSFVYWDAG